MISGAVGFWRPSAGSWSGEFEELHGKRFAEDLDEQVYEARTRRVFALDGWGKMEIHIPFL